MAHPSDRSARAPAGPGTKTHLSTAAVGPGSRSSRDTPAWCALSSRATRASTGSRANGLFLTRSLPRCDEELTHLAHRSVSAATLGHIVGDGLHWLRSIGYCAC